jgi:hypothetical protein
MPTKYFIPDLRSGGVYINNYAININVNDLDGVARDIKFLFCLPNSI